MKVLVKYSVFVPDNHQGGMGYVRDFETFLEFSDNTMVSEVKKEIKEKIDKEVREFTHDWTDNCYKIISSRILN